MQETTVRKGSSKVVSYAVDGNIATVTINRPEKLNALNSDTRHSLRDVFTRIKGDRAIDVVIVTGAGEKAFAAGTDIGELVGLDSETGKDFSAKGQSVLDQVENLGKPVVAAINGYALGGGCELALACHIRIASDKAKFGLPEVNLGLIPGYGGTQRLPRVIGKGRAMEMILTGKQIDAEEALRIGLVNRVVPSSELMRAALSTAETIAQKGQLAIRMALKSVNITQEATLSDGLDLESSLFGLCAGSDDGKEGAKAFLEKRKPKFKNSQ